MQAEEALERLLEKFQRLEERLERLDRRLDDVERVPDPVPAPLAADEEAPPAPDTRIERMDPFEPAVHRSSATRHMNAVNKALSMLGLMPESEEEEQQRKEATARHKDAISKALHVLGMKAAAPEPETQSSAGHAAALARAREMLGKPAPAETEPAPAGAAPPLDTEAIAQEAVVPDLEAEEAPAEEAVVPAPDLPPQAPKWEVAQRAADGEALDLDGAVAIDLEKPSLSARDYAVPILNVLALLVAAGAALYAGGAITEQGFARDAWRELAIGGLAVLCGVTSVLWRSASIHLRALLAGSSALLLHLLVLVLMAPRLPLPGIYPLGACAAASLIGATLVVQTRHPLALLLGFGVALALPFWFAPQPELRLPYAAAINIATAVCAYRLHRLQASVAAAVPTCVLVYGATGPLALPYGALFAGVFLVQALSWPFLNRKQNAAAAILAFPGLALAAWTVLRLYDGAPWMKVGALFGVAAILAIAAVFLPRRQALMRGALKAGALLLLLAALAGGMSGANMVPITLFLALVFGVFALSLYDDFLRAAGSLMLAVTIALFFREGASTPLLLTASVVATVLWAARGKGRNPRALTLALAAIAHVTFLCAIWRFFPAEAVAYVWLAAALVLQVLGRRFRIPFLQAGAAMGAGAAALWTLATSPDALSLGLVAAGIVPHFVLARDTRAGALLLLVAELLGVAAAAVALPGPLGVLATLPALLVLAGPWPRALRATFRSHARLLAVVLLVRCLFPDLLLWPVAERFANLRFAALVGAAAAGVVAVRGATIGRALLALLASGVLGAAVWQETHLRWAGLAAALFGALACLGATRLGRGRQGSPAAEAEAVEVPEVAVEDIEMGEFAEAPDTEAD